MIAHFDVDAFYASVEIRDDPSLRAKPVAVAGTSRRAVVLTASYEARPYGVKSAVPLYRALEACPQLVVVAPNMQKYRAVSREIFTLLGKRGHTVEGLSLDEAFVDLGDVTLDTALALARSIRAEVRAATGLTLSAGVATGKMVAKILSDSCKPDGLQGLAPGEEAAFLAPLPVGRLWGVGPKTQERLRGCGIATIGDVAALDDAGARALFGSWGVSVRDLARGVDRRPVVGQRESKSISTEETFEYDEGDERALLRVLRRQALELAEKLARDQTRARTVGIKAKRADRRVLVRQTNFMQPTADARRIFAAAAHCLRRLGLGGAPLRLLGTRVAGLSSGEPQQTGLFER